MMTTLIIGLRILHEGRNVGSIAKVAVGLRFGRDGGRIGLVAIDTCDGDGISS